MLKYEYLYKPQLGRAHVWQLLLSAYFIRYPTAYNLRPLIAHLNIVLAEHHEGKIILTILDIIHRRFFHLKLSSTL
jgi:hypothetical protein